MKKLSEAEWNIMESLWEHSPKIGSQVAADMAEKTGWNRSTTLTMLRRMTEKKLISCEDLGKLKAYAPLIDREEAVKKATESFLDRVYHGSVSLLLNGFVEKRELTAGEIESLRQILDKAEKKNEH